MTRAEITELLDAEPWLEWYVTDDDAEPDDVRVRFVVAQSCALRALGAPLSLRHSRGELLTTSFAPHEAGSLHPMAQRSSGGGLQVSAPDQVTVEEGGTFLRAVAVPFGEDIFMISPGRRGEPIAHRERFDARSIVDIGSMFGRPILLSHDQTRPTGRVLSSRSTSRGLEVEGELLESDQALEGIRRRARGGILSRMSIGFVPNKKADVWEKPDASGLPLVIRRGVEVREISLVLWGAFDGARVTGIYARTAAAVERHAASEKAIAETQAVTRDVAAILGRRRA